jgi:hypothetical protein
MEPCKGCCEGLDGIGPTRAVDAPAFDSELPALNSPEFDEDAEASPPCCCLGPPPSFPYATIVPLDRFLLRVDFCCITGLFGLVVSAVAVGCRTIIVVLYESFLPPQTQLIDRLTDPYFFVESVPFVSGCCYRAHRATSTSAAASAGRGAGAKAEGKILFPWASGTRAGYAK